jgi:hypothetical protein
MANDATDDLCVALYGRLARAADYLGGSNAQMLKDAARQISRMNVFAEEAKTHLCIFDTRNPNHTPPHFLDEPVEPRIGCCCDNCFYGRDKLALIIIGADRPDVSLGKTTSSNEVCAPSETGAGGLSLNSQEGA